MTNYTLQDIAGSSIAVLAFATVLWAPGYVVAHCTNLFQFRIKTLAERSVWAVACSFSVVPLAAYLGGRFTSLNLVCWAAVVLAVAATFLLIQEAVQSRPRRLIHRREWVLAAALLGGWAVFVIASLVDVQVGNKLYFSVTVFDQGYRVAFTDAVTRTGVPPANPLFFAGHPQAMRYYYFWYVVCAMVARIAHVSARQAFLASSVWAGIGVACVVVLYTRYFMSGHNTRRQVWWSVVLLAVTGADLLPALGSLFAATPLNGEMEWWSNDQISSWMDSLLWVPHHVAGLLCCLMSFLLLWRTREPLRTRQRASAVVLAGIAFASAFGLSIYVAFGFALMMVAWIARLAVAGVIARTGSPGSIETTAPESRGKLCGRVLLAGMVSVTALMPFMRELTESTSQPHTAAAAPHLFSLSVRRIIDPQLVAGLPWLAVWNRTHPVLLDQVLRVILLLPGLALELGFYGAVLIFFWRARRQGRTLDEAHATALYLTVCGLVIVSFVRSSVISNNDFGYRAALLPQFFLLLLGGSLMASWSSPHAACVIPSTPARRAVTKTLLGLGLAASVYQAVMLRVFVPIEEAHPGSGFAYLPAAAFQARDALGKLNRVASRSAVLEFHPTSPATDSQGDVVPPFLFYERILLMNAGHQLLNAEPCAAEFGGNPLACKPIVQATDRIYALPAPSGTEAQTYCKRFGVDYLIVTSVDPAWSDRAGWVALLPAVASEPNLKILACGA